MIRPRSVEALLMQQIGLDPESVGATLIPRGLQARMTALGLTDRREYERLVSSSTQELQELIEEIVVPESWFFRDDRPFMFLKDHVRSGWLDNPDRSGLRALSVPCAMGEEPYSIAIALLDLGLPAERFHVDAIDISDRSLARARRAVYSRNAFRGQDLGFQARYFHTMPAGYELDPAVRGTVRFLRGNLVDPDLLVLERPYDVIFCRNLLIYLTDDARRQASKTLVRLLAGSGVLFLGHAERADFGGAMFVPTGEKGSFAYRRDVPQPSLCLPGPPALPALAPPKTNRPVPRRNRPAPEQTRARTEPAAAPEPPPLPPKTSPVEPHQPAPQAPVAKTLHLLDQAAELAGQGRYDDGVALCEQSIREAGPSAHAYFLIGIIRQAAGDRDKAEASFQKTLYLEPQHDEALLALALLAERRGDDASAVGYRRRAERALARKGVR